jgi:hypothetical protein
VVFIVHTNPSNDLALVTGYELSGMLCPIEVITWADAQGPFEEEVIWRNTASKVSDGVDAPTQRHLCARMVVLEPSQERASMEKVSIIGLDLAKNIIQVHAASADGSVLFRRKISNKKLLAFLSGSNHCVVAMEACAGSHRWGREVAKLGHQVKLIAPIYVKPFVKRQKNDAAGAGEPPRLCRRPQLVRSRVYDKQNDEQIFS